MMNAIHAFSFCPRCGSKFSNAGKECLGCDACGLRYYISPKPCSGVIPISESGEILLTERAFEPHQGKLDMLGGFLKEGETFEEGARREAKEELGLLLSNLKYVTSYTHGYTYQDIDYALATTIFTTRVTNSTKFEASDDVAGYKFFKPQYITAEMLAFSELKVVINNLFKQS